MNDPEFRELQNPLQVRAEIVMLEEAVFEYARRNDNRYPASLELLMKPNPDSYSYLNVKELPLDPWDNEYVYQPPTPEDPIARITCYRRDGVPGGEGADADVTNLD